MARSEAAYTFNDQSGVTLLELLVVLLILASVTAAIAVPMVRPAPSEADQVAALTTILSNAQWRARQSQTPVSVAAASGQSSEAAYTLPDYVTVDDAEPGNFEFVFFADGSARAPRLRLGQRVVHIDVLTGAVDVQ